MGGWKSGKDDGWHYRGDDWQNAGEDWHHGGEDWQYGGEGWQQRSSRKDQSERREGREGGWAWKEVSKVSKAAARQDNPDTHPEAYPRLPQSHSKSRGSDSAGHYDDDDDRGNTQHGRWQPKRDDSDSGAAQGRWQPKRD